MRREMTAMLEMTATATPMMAPVLRLFEVAVCPVVTLELAFRAGIGTISWATSFAQEHCEIEKLCLS